MNKVEKAKKIVVLTSDIHCLEEILTDLKKQQLRPTINNTNIRLLRWLSKEDQLAVKNQMIKYSRKLIVISNIELKKLKPNSIESSNKIVELSDRIEHADKFIRRWEDCGLREETYKAFIEFGGGYFEGSYFKTLSRYIVNRTRKYIRTLKAEVAELLSK